MRILGTSGASLGPWPGDFLAALAALGIDSLGLFGRFELFLLLLLVSWATYGQAVFLQHRWAAALSSGAEKVPLARLELGSTLPWLLLLLLTWPLRATYRGLRGLYRWISEWLHRRERARSGEEEQGTGPEEADRGAEEPDETALLVATLGPSFALAALITAALYVFCLGLAPAVATSLGLPRATHGVWESLFLGSRPELGGWSLAGSASQAATLVALALWLPVWSTLARLIRLFHGHSLGRNLIAERDRASTLDLWRRAFATRHLVAPSEPYRHWAVPMVSCAVIGLGSSWFLLGQGGPRPADFAIAWIACLGWVIHLRLRGEERVPVAAPEPEPVVEPTAGWEDVLADLSERLQIEEPAPREPPREIPPLSSAKGISASGSPLLGELLPAAGSGATGTMNEMQRYELARLTRASGVFPREGPSPGELTLSHAHREKVDSESNGEAHRIVLAPEGWGKSTLGFLAAVDQALSHARATLIVVRGADQVRTFEERFRPRLEGSTLRWNVQFRLLGGDLSADRARGVEPDVLVCDLHGLVVDLLAHRERHGRFLRRTGLVVIDGVEGFSGPAEVHAQLAFRRLRLALAHARGLDLLETAGNELGGPTFLVTGRETMFRADRWIHDLCSIEASVGRHGPEGLWGSARQEVSSEPESESEIGAKPETELGAEPETEMSRRQQQLYRLQDFTAPCGREISPGQLVTSCERLGVPWHHRRCGASPHAQHGQEAYDGDLDLLEHPRWRVDGAAACVLLLAGSWSAVQRELHSLRRAGAGFQGSGAVALITLCDDDEERAFAPHDQPPSLRPWLERLPLPILRQPSGAALEAHLAADLLQGWNEVGELVQVYGPEVGDRLRNLARRERLLADSRVDVAPADRAFARQLYVRALEESELGGEPVQVELSGPGSTQVVDRSTRLPLLQIDARAAHLAFYPGRIFTTRGGRYVLAETEAWEGEPTGGEGPTSTRLWADPVLIPEVSSPRRRIRAQVLFSSRAVEPATVGQEADPRPEPLHFGSFPVAVTLARAEVSSEHFATLRIDRSNGEVRQKHVVGAGRGRRASWSLVTETLHLYPAPLGEEADSGPSLRLGSARLIAAAMRLVLPSLYRGGGESLGVGLCLENDPVEADPFLGSADAFVFFDLGSGSTGAARALRRDGLELLLRLARLALDRLGSHRRLLALHDEWADAANPWGAGVEPEDEEGEEDAERSTREAEHRRAALEWLDSRLRSEEEPLS